MYFNDNSRGTFKVKTGVRQGNLLAPYIFLIVRNTLTHIIKKWVKEGRLKGIMLQKNQAIKYLSIYE